MKYLLSVIVALVMLGSHTSIYAEGKLKGFLKSKAYEMELPYEDEAPQGEVFPLGVQAGAIESHGLIQIYFVSSDETTDQFKLRRGELSFKGSLTEDVSFFVMFDPSKNLAEDKKVSGTTVRQVKKDASVLQDLGLTLKVLNQKVVVGQFKRPMSLEGLQSSGVLELLERATVVQVLGDKRDVGAMVQGDVTAFKMQYMVALYNGEGSNSPETNEKKDVAAMVIWKPLNQTQVYGSVYEGTQGATNAAQDRLGVGGRTQWGPVLVRLEYLTAKDGAVEKDGWYVLGSYSFADQELKLLKPLRVSARYEEWDANKDDAKELHIVTVGAQYLLDPKETSKVGVDLFYTDGKGSEPDDFGVSAGWMGKF